MNIRTEQAGYPSEEEILECGFKICGSWDYNDMGQATYKFNDYSKDDKLFLKGGFWNYTIGNKQGKVLFDGWFNTKQELLDTIAEIEKTLVEFKVNDYVELINHISDGYNKIGDYNVIFPPPTIVQIVEIKEDGWLKYGVKVIKEKDLPENLRGKQFRAAMSNYAKSGNIKFIGDKQSFFDGDDAIEQKHFDKIYYQPESYLRPIGQ